jgi:hypothetical protein
MHAGVEHRCKSVTSYELLGKGDLRLSFDCGVTIILLESCAPQAFEAIMHCLWRRVKETIPPESSEA